jgi:archaellum biogenesis ATPase FlaH
MSSTHHQKFRYLDSVWRSTFSEFRDYINGITNKSITIQEALGTIREVKCLPKKYYLINEGNNNKTITVQDISNNKQIADQSIIIILADRIIIILPKPRGYD